MQVAEERIWLTAHTLEFSFIRKTQQLIGSQREKNTVETSTFGAELIAARIAMEKFKALRTKLWWIGITIDGPTYMFCDNDSFFEVHV